MSLAPNDRAYNACVEALNIAEARLNSAVDERARAWEACEALHPLGEHGRGTISKKKLILVPAKA